MARKATAAASEFTPPEGFTPRGHTQWKPNPGEWIHGTYQGSMVVKSRARGRKAGEDYAIHMIRDNDNGTIWTCSGSALTQRFAGIEPGTEVYVVFRGLTKLGGGKTFKEFEVYGPSDSDKKAKKARS